MESSDEEEESVMDLCQEDGENEITSTVDNGQGEGKTEEKKPDKKETAGSIEIQEEEEIGPLSISSDEEEETAKDDVEATGKVMEVVDVNSGDESSSVEEIKSPAMEIKSSPAKKAKVSKEDQERAEENQASVDDIMSEFVDELIE